MGHRERRPPHAAAILRLAVGTYKAQSKEPTSAGAFLVMAMEAYEACQNCDCSYADGRLLIEAGCPAHDRNNTGVGVEYLRTEDGDWK